MTGLFDDALLLLAWLTSWHSGSSGSNRGATVFLRRKSANRQSRPKESRHD